MKKLVWIVLGLVILGGAGYLATNGDKEATGTTYRFVELERGDLEAVVSSTGNLSAVTTVQVGTQVSGIISAIYVDFNDRVRRGQIVARIDTTLLASSVRDAQANLQRNQAQLRQAEREFERIKGLYDEKFVSEIDYNTAVYNRDAARASTASAEIALERARLNLDYATIRSPIAGTVIERNVDVGQTVAASLSAPQLFLIANDLADMQILASVDESDIGSIKTGQTARFTVQAYPDDTFEGTVRQVRLQSNTQENIVTYTVVVDVNNDDGRLLPGMTATIDFLIERADGVLAVPNAALRFRPTASMIAEFRAGMEARVANAPDSVRSRFASRNPGGSDGADTANSGSEPGAGVTRNQGGGTAGASGFGGGVLGGGRSADMVSLWYLDAGGELQMARARTGITDGQKTEVEARDLEPGMQIIAGVSQSSSDESVNPFQSQQSGRFRPGGF